MDKSSGNNKMADVVHFRDKTIKTVIVGREYFYAIIDVLNIFLESSSPKNYWSVLKRRKSELITVCNEFTMKNKNGKDFKMDCANKKGLLCILQSLPLIKSKAFEVWFDKLPN